jgi:hypothetical protein
MLPNACELPRRYQVLARRMCCCKWLRRGGDWLAKLRAVRGLTKTRIVHEWGNHPAEHRSALQQSHVCFHSSGHAIALALVREVPEAVVSTRSKRRLFDYVGGGHLHDRWHREAERLRRFEIDDEFDLRGLLHRKFGGVLTLEDAIDIEGSLAELGI